MRILISNVYSYLNKGDAAIVVALVKEIDRVFGKPDIIAQTNDVANDEGKYGVPVTDSLLWLVASSVRERPFLVRLWTLLMGISTLMFYLLLADRFRVKARFLLSAPLLRFVEENKQADLVIACGGGYLRTSNGSARSFVLLALTCINFLAAKKLGKPVYLYSQSIGPVHGPFQRLLLAFALNRVDLVQVRERISLELLQSLKVKTPVYLTADAAFLLTGKISRPPSHRGKRTRPISVGLTVRKWFDNEKDFEQYINSIAGMVDQLADLYGAHVYFVPQVIADKFGDDDILAAEKLQSLIRRKGNFHLIRDDLHPVQIMNFCGQMDLFVGTRMHSNIFALVGGVPVVAISYEHKTHGIMRSLHLQEFSLSIDTITTDSLCNAASKILSNRMLHSQSVKEAVAAQAEEARRAIEIIKFSAVAHHCITNN